MPGHCHHRPPTPNWPDQLLFEGPEGTVPPALDAESLPTPHQRWQRPEAPRARTVSRIRIKGQVRTGSRDAIAGPGARTGAGWLWLPEASEARPLRWLILSWGGSGWRGIQSNLPFGPYSLRAGPPDRFFRPEVGMP